MPTQTFRLRRPAAVLGLAATTALAAACGRGADTRAVADDALRNDLTLATQAQQRPQQYVSPQELGATPYGAQPMGAGYANGAYVAPAPAAAPVRERVVYRDRPATTTRRRSSSSSGTYASSAAREEAEAAAARDRARTRSRHRTQGATVGAVTGAAIGAVTSGRRDRAKGAVLGGVAGGVLGAVIGNNRNVP